MKKKLLLVLLMFVSLTTFSQNKLKAFFVRNVDTLFANSKKDIDYSFKIVVPKQKGFKKISIDYILVPNEFQPPISEIFLPSNRPINIEETDNINMDIGIIKFSRHLTNDKLIILKIVAKDKNGKQLAVADSNSTLRIYIKPVSQTIVNPINTIVRHSRAFFEKEIDTIQIDSRREINHVFNIIIPAQRHGNSVKIGYKLVENEFQLPNNEIFLPDERTFTVDSVVSSTLKRNINIKFLRNNTVDRVVEFKLYVIDKDNLFREIKDTSIIYKIYIKPFNVKVAFKPIPILNTNPLKAYFTKKNDTLVSNTNKEEVYSLKIEVPNQVKYDSAFVDFYIAENDIQLSNDDIYISNNRPILVTKSGGKIVRTYQIKIKRDDNNDKQITFKLKATDTNGKSIPLLDSNLVCSLYIKPYVAGVTNTMFKDGHELLFYTGTNLDFLDGISAKDLYFKTSYTFRINSLRKKPRVWINFELGKNRYTSSIDTLKNNQRFFELGITKPFNDSIDLTLGYYGGTVTSKYENLFFNINSMYLLESFSNDESALLFQCGLSTSYRDIFIDYSTKVISSTTKSFLYSNHINYIDSLSRNYSMPRSYKYKELNNFIHVGICHYLTTKSLNIRSKFQSGINIFSLPIYSSQTVFNTKSIFYEGINMFYKLEFNCTVINPGISLGFEALFRQTALPLINITLSKTLGASQITSLFSSPK